LQPAPHSQDIHPIKASVGCFAFFLGFPLTLLMTSLVTWGMIYISGGSDELTSAGYWMSSVLMLLFISFSISIILAIETLRAKDENKKKWKKFWNIVEILWLLSAGLAIFGYISAARPLLMQVIDDIHHQELDDAAKKIGDSAKVIQGEFCKSDIVDEKICSSLAVFADINEYSQFREEETVNIEDVVGQFIREHPKHVLRKQIYFFIADLRRFEEKVRLLKLESRLA
jgi:hypothetical protein